ncbi:tellurium resistance protein TerZ [Nocardia tenerifensis]|uniref:Tellurium resistance protein TerZ n=2 Tax=Nocardia tenerifensis TaxID=228006 RepID=A0A318KH18_9NOCA|nr:tellurium resistance protein TerZ [Nocardia tenerifensis]
MFINLCDTTGAALEHLGMALGWDPVQPRRFGGRTRDIDLNAAALLFAGTQIIDVVYHEQLSSRDGSVRHLGDSMTGEGKGDNEVVTVDLTRIPPQVDTILFLVTSYTGQSFDQIDNAFCRVIDSTSGTEIAHYNLSGGAHTGLVMGKVVRAANFWRFEPLGATIHAQHPVEAVPHMAPFLTTPQTSSDT